MTSTGEALAGRREVAVCSPVDVCAFVDDLEPTDVGELVLESHEAPSGSVFIEHGRVCWAAARGLARRFTQLLVAHTGASPEVVERVVVGCLADRAPLGERLLEARVVSAEQLRATLLQHAAESLHVACLEPVWGRWHPRRSRGYASRFTFSTAEMLARSLAEENAFEAQEAGRRIREAFDPEESGVAFVRRGDRGVPQPVAVSGSWPREARTLIEIGRWASSAIDVASEAGAEPFIATTRGDASLVAWPAGRLVLAGLTTELGAARILTRFMRSRREERKDSNGRL